MRWSFLLASLVLAGLSACGPELAVISTDAPADEASSALGQVAAPWAKPRQNARNTGVSSLGAETPDVRWKFAVDGPDRGNNVSSDPVIDGAGNVYFGCRGGAMSVTPSGALRWRFAAPAANSVGNGVQLLADGTALVSTSDGVLSKVNQQTGARVWSVTTGSSSISPAGPPLLALANGTIFVGSQVTKELLALDAAGKKLWSVRLAGQPVGGMGLRSDGLLYVAVGTPTGAEKPAVQLIDPSRKRVVWTWSPTGFMPAFLGGVSVTALDRALVAPYYSGKVFALDPKVAGGVAWTWQTTTPSVSLWSAPLIGPDGTLYVAEGEVLGIGVDKRIVALTPQGTQRWATTVRGNINMTPVMSRTGTLYALSQAEPDGPNGKTELRLYALNASTGAIRWSYLFVTTGGWPSANVAPALGNGRIYVGINEGYTGATPSGPSQAGSLYAFGAATLLPDFGEGDVTTTPVTRKGVIRIDSVLYTPQMGFAAWMPRNSQVQTGTPPLDVPAKPGFTWVWFGNIEGWVESSGVQLQ